MYINPVGAGPAAQQGARPGTGAANLGDTVQGAEVSSSNLSQSANVAASSSSLSMTATQMSTSQSISSLITTFAPYSADQDLMKLLLLLIALEIISGQDKQEQKGGGVGLMFLQAGGEQSFQSIEYTQSEMSISYGISAYSEQNQTVSESSSGGSAGEASAGDGAGQNLDLQA